MSEINYEAQVDELSKPGNEAELEKTLNDGFNAAGSGPADVQPDQNNNVPTEIPATDTPGINNPAPAPAPADDDQQPGAPSNDGTPANDGTGDRFKDILSDRNQAREAAANAQTENQVLAEQVKNLTEVIQKMQSGEGAAPNDGGAADDQPLTAKGVEDMVKNILEKTTQDKAAKEAAEKSDAEEVAKLFADENFGEAAKPFEGKIKEVMTAHPTVSALAAYAMAVGLDALQGGKTQAPASNVNKTVVGNRTKTNLRREVKPSDMPEKDQEAYLQKEAAAGRLKV